MVKFDRSIVINMPVNQVFAFAGTGYGRNLPQWSSDLQEWEQVSGGVGAGAKFRQVRLIRGKPEASNVEVTEFEKNRKFSFQADGNMPAKGTYLFEPEGEATKVSVFMDIEPGGLGKLAGPIISREAGKSLEGDLQRLKQIIESA